MIVALVVFVVGLFAVPAVLLAWGRRVRKLGRPRRRAFWGAVIGHCIGAIGAGAFGMMPPEAWSSTDLVRGFFGYFGLLAFPVAGGLAGYVTSRHLPAQRNAAS
ncbi:MAG TPA: hypothetical protein VF981_17455 [Gemmatimonadaceae bacterium]